MSYSTPELKDNAESIIKEVTEKLNASGIAARYTNDETTRIWPACEGEYCLLVDNTVHFYISEERIGWRTRSKSTGKLKVYVNTFYTSIKTFHKREIEADKNGLIDILVKAIKLRMESRQTVENINISKTIREARNLELFQALAKDFPEYSAFLTYNNYGYGNLYSLNLSCPDAKIREILQAMKDKGIII